jgi:pimeloyl-ACP methyl ester carboxylesterase
MLVALRQTSQPDRRAVAAAALDARPPAPITRTAIDAAGREIAWTASGVGGPALVDVSGWLTHLLLGWRDPLTGAFQRELCAERRVLRYDRPGMGLSAAHPPAASLDADVDALEAVVRASGDDRVALFAHGFGAAAAIGFSVRHPGLVSHLVLFGASPRPFGGLAGGALTPRLADALHDLAKADWNLAARTLADLMLSCADHATLTAFAEQQRAAASGATAAHILRTLRDLDVTPLLARIAVPTLLLHRRDDRLVPLHAARAMAAQIRGARVEVLDGAEHLPHFGDTAAVHATLSDASSIPPPTCSRAARSTCCARSPRD